MHQSHLLQKIKGTVNGGRRRPDIPLQHLEHLVGADRFVLLPDQFEDPSPDGGDTLPLPLAKSFGVPQRLGNTELMIVCMAYKWCR